MPRIRRLTEHLGLMVSKQEEAIFKAYVKSRRETASDYFRRVAIRPLMELAQTEVGSDGEE